MPWTSRWTRLSRRARKHAAASRKDSAVQKELARRSQAGPGSPPARPTRNRAVALRHDKLLVWFFRLATTGGMGGVAYSGDTDLHRSFVWA
jgi:hypothetical protein